MEALLSLLQGRLSYSQEESSLRVRRNGQLFMLTHQIEDVWQYQFPRWSQQCFVILTKRNDKLMHWDSIRPVLMRAFAREGAQDSSDKNRLRLIHEGSTKRKLENCTDKNGNLIYFRAIQGHCGGIPISPELMKYTPIPYKWKEYIYHRGSSWIFQSTLGSGIIPEGKEKDRARQAVFLTPLTPFGKDPKKNKPSVPQKVPYETRWKYNQDAENWVRLSKAQDRGLQFWQKKSIAIMAYATIPGDCIDRVIAQNGDRVIFERLATPLKRPAAAARTAAAAARSNRRNKLWKQRTIWESQAEVQDDSKHITETDQAPGNRMQSISKTFVDTHLGDKEVSTDAFSNNEANNQVIERVKIGSNKICIREDLAKEKMVFSQESSQAVFEMGNVKLIELKTSLIQCPFLHHVLKGTILCECGKHIRPDLDIMRRIKAAFEILKAPCFRTSAIPAMGCKYGPNLWPRTSPQSKRRSSECFKRQKRIYVDLGQMAT